MRTHGTFIVLLVLIFTASHAGAQTLSAAAATDRPLLAASTTAPVSTLDDLTETTGSSRRSDSLLNGALIGAGVGAASGLLMCRTMEPWDVCLGDIGPIATAAAIGAGVGIGIDALIRSQRMAIYQSRDGSKQLHAAPIASRRARGVALTLRF